MSNSHSSASGEIQAERRSVIPAEQARPCLPVTLAVIGKYLIGNREAILTLAAHPQTIWMGLLFVVSAGLAREYDREDLLHEPWHAGLPLAASLATSCVLFSLAFGLLRRRGDPLSQFGARYRSFLGLYWMTAPLAWIYGIPVERLFTAGVAANWNVNFLGLVACWRVLLITRVMSVIWGVSFWSLFWIVMLFADTLALVLVSYIDVQIFAVMGGVRLNEGEAVLAGLKALVMFFGVVSWPLWMIGTLVTTLYIKGASRNWQGGLDRSAPPVPRSTWIFSVGMIALWACCLPWTQPEQQRRRLVEREIRAGRYGAGLAHMSAFPQSAFPPHWDPPPSIGSRRERPRILPVIEALTATTAPWVRQVYFDKMDAALGRNEFPMENLWAEADLGRILSALIRQPEGLDILRRHRQALSYLGSSVAISTLTQAEINQIFVQLTRPPAERSTSARSQPWTPEEIEDWHRFLSELSTFTDEQFMIDTYGPRLRELLSAEQQLPGEIKTRIQQLLKR